MRLTTLGLALGLLLATGLPALAKVPPDAIEVLAERDVFVQDGAEKVSEPALQAAVDRAASRGIVLKIAVLSQTGNAEDFAVALRDALGSVTVIVFTPHSYGVASATLNDGRLSTALAALDDALATGTVSAGVDAFVDALQPSEGLPWGPIIGVLAVGLLVLAFGGRFWDSKARSERLVRRIDRRKKGLAGKASEIADEVLDLADHVELADSTSLSERYRDAAASFQTTEAGIGAADTMHDLDQAEKRIDALTAAFAEIRSAVTTK